MKKKKYFIYLLCKYAISNNKFKFYYSTITHEDEDKTDKDKDGNKIENKILSYAIENENYLLKDIFKIIFEEYKLEYDISDENFLNFDIEDYLLEDTEYKLKYKNGILEIPNSNLENIILKIDFNIDKEMKKIITPRNKEGVRVTPLKYKPIIKLLENIDKSEEIDIMELIDEEEVEEKEMNISRIKKEIEKVNKFIKNKMSEKGVKIGEFIEYKVTKYDTKNERRIRAKISESFR